MKQRTVLIPGSKLKPGDVVRVNGDDYTIHTIIREPTRGGGVDFIIEGNTGTGCHIRTFRKDSRIRWSVVPPAGVPVAHRTEPGAYGPVPGPPINPTNVKPKGGAS